MSSQPVSRKMMVRYRWRGRLTAVVVAAGCAAALAGCTGTTGAFSDAFVDPSIYDLYDCKQLATERTSLAAQLAANQKLIDKARTGVAGDAVAEVAYGNTNLSLRGQMRLADRMWEKNRCDAGPATLPPQPSSRQR